MHRATQAEVVFREELEQSSVKELRRQAALRSVPLTHISAALEKKDLVNLILNAKPVTDQYDINSNRKVHTAESIAAASRAAERKAKLPKDKKKKKKRKASSSSRSSDSGKKKKRSRSRKPATKGRRKKSRSSSDCVEMIIPMIEIGKKDKPILEIADTSTVSVPSAINIPKARMPTTAAAKAKAAAEKAAAEPPTEAARGMAAAAALGYNVLPKAASSSLKAAAGSAAGILRPSINTGGNTIGAQGLSNSRICTSYLQFARCDMGANCPDAHITDPDEEMRVRAKFKLQECKFGATCTRKGCLFRHPGEITEEYQAVPMGQGWSLRPDKDGQLKVVWQ